MSGNEERQERNLPQVLANNAMTLAMASMIALMPSGAIADDVVLANNVNLGFMSMAAVELPEGWESSITPEGKEYFYNTVTRQSQWEPPQGATQEKSKAVKRKKSGDLREVVSFEVPVIPIDKVTKKDAPTLTGACGEGEFRFNSVECAASQKKDAQGGSKAAAADERYRMLQAAEMKSLEKTKLFKDLQSKTQDPVRMAERQKEIDRITIENDIGSTKAPWASDSDRPPPARLELPKLELPKLSLPKLSMPKLPF